MNKVFTILFALLMVSSAANATLIQHIDFEPPSDGGLDNPPQNNDDNTDTYAPRNPLPVQTDDNDDANVQ